MRSGLPVPIGSLLTVVVVTSMAGVPLAGQPGPAQPKSAAPATWKAPRTSWGDPDLQGQWNSQTSTPLERPGTGPLAGKETLSDEEAESLESKHLDQFDAAPRTGDPGTYNSFWRDSGKPLARTSLIVDPPDGRVPPLTPEAQRREEVERADRSKRGPADTYEDFTS